MITRPCIRILLFALLATQAGLPASQPDKAAFDAPAIDVLHYEVELSPNLPARSVAGTERIEFRATTTTAMVEFDCGDLEIQSVRDGARPMPFTVKDRRLRLQWREPLKEGDTRKISIVYHGTPRRGMTFEPDREQIYTVFSTSQWMVAVDAPADRATLRMRLTVPDTWAAAGSGELVSRRRSARGTATYDWELRTAAPTYTFGFAAGRFSAVQEQRKGVTFRYMGAGFSDTELRQIFRDTPGMFAFFESRAGVAYAAPSYTQVLTVRGIGQEMAQLAIMPERHGRDVLADERESELTAHEAAHQWWGNMVTCREWTDFWLNEGFATFMAAAYKEQRFGRPAYLREIDRIRGEYERVRGVGKDRPLVFPDWSRPTAEDRTVVYQKGAYVLHLLREELGDQAFWKGIRAYTQQHFGRAVVTRDFQSAMERSSGRSLAAFFTKWMYGPAPQAQAVAPLTRGKPRRPRTAD